MHRGLEGYHEPPPGAVSTSRTSATSGSRRSASQVYDEEIGPQVLGVPPSPLPCLPALFRYGNRMVHWMPIFRADGGALVCCVVACCCPKGTACVEPTEERGGCDNTAGGASAVDRRRRHRLPPLLCLAMGHEWRPLGGALGARLKLARVGHPSWRNKCRKSLVCGLVVASRGPAKTACSRHDRRKSRARKVQCAGAVPFARACRNAPA